MEKGNIRRFGTFNGVFLPTTLSILGVILFLRTGWTIGSAGLFGAISILFIAVSISLITALSISSLSTNITVGEGGIYYIVSRSLGIEMGGSIGIPLYISQAISVSFYILGFTESLKWLIPDINTIFVAFFILVIFTVIAYIGADFAVKVQYVIFGILLLAILSIFITPHWIPLKENFSFHFPKGYNFWKVFAVFFPAVTGITAGVGMSGELSNPEKNIPKGILYAIFFTTIIYLLTIIKFSSIAGYKGLINSPLIVTHITPFPYLVYAGIWSATLSSALTFVVSAPRTLQALSKDRIVPKFFGKNLGSRKDEPRSGILITFIIAGVVILTSNLNSVAIMITIFFLITYGLTNLACGLESLIKNPSFRPKFKVAWWLSFIGVIATIGVMKVINTLITVLSIIFLLLLYILLRKRELEQTWGDVREGFWFSLIRSSLFKLQHKKKTLHNWRPNVMVFSGMPENRLYLVKFANWLGKGNGIITLFNISTGEVERLYKDREKSLEEMESFIMENKLPVFPEVEIVGDLTEGIKTISQAHRLGYLDSNLVLLGWGLEGKKGLRLSALIRELCLLGKNVIVLKYAPLKGFGNKKLIDIWWGGRGKNEGLMLYIAYILSLNREWHNVKLRVLNVSPKSKIKKMREFINDRLNQAKINTELVMLSDEHENPFELLNRASSNADLIIAGMQYPSRHREKVFLENLNQATNKDLTYLLVRSIEIEEFFFEENP